MMFSQCENINELKDPTDQADNNTDTLENVSIPTTIKGFIQKGPFSNGSSVTISDLNNNFNPTGKTFISSIFNDLGEFTINDVKLTSGNVEILADGFFFDENSGKLSQERIQLGAIFNVSDSVPITVNLLTHLEKERVKTLLSEGKKFNDAKAQSQKEVLNIFGYTSNSLINSEQLNITNTTEGDAILLAISTIFMGSSSVADLSKLLADIIVDIKADGSLNNADLKNQLVKQAYWVNSKQVAANILEKYKSKNISKLPNFESYLNQFMENNPIENKLLFTYPQEGSYGTNILAIQDTIIKSDVYYSLSAIVPKNGNLKISIKGDEGVSWFYAVDSRTGWTISNYDNTAIYQTFTSQITQTPTDLKLVFKGNGKVNISYFENNLDNPTQIKKLIINNEKGGIYFYDGDSGRNILAMNTTKLKTNVMYSVQINTKSSVSGNIVKPQIKIYFNETTNAYELDTLNTRFKATLKSNEIILDASLKSFNDAANCKIKFIKPCFIKINGPEGLFKQINVE